MSISAVTSDAAGRGTSWVEGDYTFSVSRDTAGRPLYLRGKSPGRAQISAEFKYLGTGGAFSGINGNVTTAMLSALLGEATTAGAVPIYGTVDGSGNVTGLISPKRVAIAGAGVDLHHHTAVFQRHRQQPVHDGDQARRARQKVVPRPSVQPHAWSEGRLQRSACIDQHRGHSRDHIRRLGRNGSPGRWRPVRWRALHRHVRDHLANKLAEPLGLILIPSQMI